MPLGIECCKGHLIFFESFCVALDAETVEHAGNLSLAPNRKIKFRFVPNLLDFIELLLDFQLFVGRFGNINDVLYVLKQISVDEVAHKELIWIFVIQCLAGNFADLLPMPWLDRGFLEVDDVR